jgi:hypothetical protein
MNYPRILLAAVVATIAFFVYGFLVHGIVLASDYLPYPEGVYRSGDAAKSHMLYGLAGIFVAILVFAIVYANSYKGGRGLIAGARLGLLFGIFIVGAFVAVNYGTINISGKLALELAISALIEWTMVGVLVGIVYKPTIV